MDDIPCAVHWYNWHQIPYDTGCPHYFPAKVGFAEAIARVRAQGVRVMPYINAHVWDTANEDFNELGRPAAVKNENGDTPQKIYEGNIFAPMCPATPLWQETVTDLVLKLSGPEFEVDGVYLDQISAHKHPTGCIRHFVT